MMTQLAPDFCMGVLPLVAASFALKINAVLTPGALARYSSILDSTINEIELLPLAESCWALFYQCR